MSRSLSSMIKEFERNIEASAGRKTRLEAAAGGTTIAARGDAAEIAQWMKAAVAKLEKAVGAATSAGILDRCGERCARSNRAMISRAKARRKKAGSLDAFLAGEQRKPITGTKLERKGNTLYWTYQPRTFSPPMRCFCPIMRGLPDGEAASPVYCQCSRAFVRTLWEEVLGCPVKVDLLGTTLTGSEECRFKIHF